MEYTGLAQQIRRNNRNSVLLLIAFPALLLGICWLLIFFAAGNQGEDPWPLFYQVVPWVIAGTGLWFLIAWTGHSAFIRLATGSKPLERKENKRVYNLLENLCISRGITTPPSVYY